MPIKQGQFNYAGQVPVEGNAFSSCLPPLENSNLSQSWSAKPKTSIIKQFPYLDNIIVDALYNSNPETAASSTY